MASFEEHGDVLTLLQKAQEADADNRELVRTVHHFLDKPDGQWEPEVTQAMEGRPRYTLDQCNDIVDDIAGEMKQADFGIRVNPAGGDATVDLAKTYNGMIRNIQAISNTKNTYYQAGRSMIAAGLDGWEVVQEWGDNDAFDQDLFIRKIPNFVDAVWFDPESVEQDRSDSKYAFKLKSMSQVDYDADFPKGSGESVSDDRSTEVYHNKASDTITIGSFYYKVPVKREIVEMSNGAVYVVDDKFEQVVDELAAANITEKRRRSREIDEVKMRLFDGGGWLNDAQDTVFKFIPLVPTYGNFKISENKVIYWGAITKKMDAQRIYNYSESRKVEEGALAPRSKLMLTREQAEADTASLESMNMNADPVQLYTHVQGQPPPFQSAGPQINPGLSEISNSALQNLRSGINLQGGPVGLRSGVAVELEQNKADTLNVKYFASQEVAICHTARILISAIPIVYDTRRQVRVLGEDGKTDMVVLHDQIMDDETKKMVELNDLSQGIYDVVCDVGPAFKNRQSEAAAGFLEVAQIDPSIMQMGKDVLLNNMTVPGMDILAERARASMIQQGLIPPDQFTDDEREAAEAAAAAAAGQPPVQEPLMIAAQAELINAQSLAAERQADSKMKQNELQMKNFGLQLKEMELDGKAQKEQNKFILDQNKQQNDNLSKQISSLADLITAAAPQLLLAQQASIVDETQDNLDNRQESPLS